MQEGDYSRLLNYLKHLRSTLQVDLHGKLTLNSNVRCYLKETSNSRVFLPRLFQSCIEVLFAKPLPHIFRMIMTAFRILLAATPHELFVGQRDDHFCSLLLRADSYDNLY